MKQLTILILSLLLFSGLLFSGCEDKHCSCCSSYDAVELMLNDTVQLKYNELYCNPEYELQLSFDSLSDSRCPIGAYCIWEGTASVKLHVQNSDGKATSFWLNTHNSFLTDTIVNGIRYEFIDLFPYPKVDMDYSLDDYILQMIISD